MKCLIFSLTVVLMLVACGKSPQEQAALLAEQSSTLCEEGQFDKARALIDSLRRTYPDNVEARKTALRLHQQVELKAAQEELLRADSLLVLACRNRSTPTRPP